MDKDMLLKVSNKDIRAGRGYRLPHGLVVNIICNQQPKYNPQPKFHPKNNDNM